MFDSRFAWTGVAVAAVAALALAFSLAPERTETTPIAEPVSGIERQDAAQPPKTAEYAYMLKEYDGHIAVFRAASEEPEFVLDVLVKYLPDFDRSQMRDGIPVKDYDQLISLIEDYVS